jgi:hypothetical protein
MSMGTYKNVKTLPQFCSVFRQPLSGARTQGGFSKMEEIFHVGSSRPQRIRAGFYGGEG